MSLKLYIQHVKEVDFLLWLVILASSSFDHLNNILDILKVDLVLVQGALQLLPKVGLIDYRCVRIIYLPLGFDFKGRLDQAAWR